jgi:hypothetical protein
MSNYASFSVTGAAQRESDAIPGHWLGDVSAAFGYAPTAHPQLIEEEWRQEYQRRPAVRDRKEPSVSSVILALLDRTPPLPDVRRTRQARTRRINGAKPIRED